jgi:hypothetical protein
MRLLLVVALLSVSSSVAFAQGSPENEPHRRFSAALSLTDPGWVEANSLDRTPMRPFSVKTWRKAGVELEVRYFSHETVEAARQTITRLAEASSIGARRTDAFGDDAYLIASPSSLRRTLIFTRGMTVLSVITVDEDVLLRAAPVFLEALDRSQRDGIVR